jgi:hypothetical protein
MPSILEDIEKLDLPKVESLVLPEAVKLVADRLGLTMVVTCRVAPEQYEIVKGGVPSGHVRVRSGRMSVDYPDAADEKLYDGRVDGFAGFTDHEREARLLLALGLIAARMNKA